MKRLKVAIKGKTDGDVQVALEEVLKKVKEGYVSGADSNDDGQYRFDVTGQESPTKESDK